MQDKIECFIVLFFLKMVKFLPTNITYALFENIGKLLFYTIKRRRDISIKNLSLAYPHLDNKTIKKIAQQNFMSIARTIAEIFMLLNDKIDINTLISNKDEAFSKIQKLFQNNKKSIIFITAHFGNWEVLAHFLATNGHPIMVIGREGNNKLIERKVTTPFREKFGNKNIYKHEAMKKMVQALRNKKNIGILIDQKAGKKNSVKTFFFQRECYTTISVATMKLRYDALVVPIFAMRKDNGKYRIILDDPIEYVGEDKETKQEKIASMVQKYNDIFEKIVRLAPEQWFWIHNRWKIP